MFIQATSLIENKPSCNKGQRCFIIATITPLHCIFNSYIIIINTHFYHKESKETFNTGVLKKINTKIR